MSRYREIYNQLSSSLNCLDADDLLREAEIDVSGNDNRATSIEAMIVYLAERVKELEANPKGS